MRQIILILILIIAPAIALTTGCVVKTEKEEVVTRPPAPAPPVEERPAPPYSTSSWVPGHWHWNGQEYVWIPGYWD